MKRLLFLLLLVPLLAGGANIDFRNLNTNHFTTNGYRVSLKDFPTNVPATNHITTIASNIFNALIGTGGVSSATVSNIASTAVANALTNQYVSWVFTNGNNATFIPGRRDKPAADPMWAKSNSPAGHTIFVGPGNYTATNLLKHNVNWYFMPGSVVTRIDVDGEVDVGLGAIFDDGPIGANGAVTSVIDGYGEFRDIHTLIQNVDFYGSILNIENAASNIKFRCAKVVMSGDTSAIFSFSVKNCDQVFVDCDEWIGSNTVGFNNCVYWEKGELYTRFKRAVVSGLNNAGSYTFWAKEPAGGATNNWYLEADLIETAAYTPFILEGVSSSYKVWIRAKEIRGGPDGGLGAAGLALATIEQIGGGKLYIDVEKINTSRSFSTARIGPCVWITGGELWLNAQKLSATQVTNQTGAVPLWVHSSGGTAHINVMHYENVGTTNGGNGIRNTGGILNINGGNINLVNGIGIVHSNGITHVRDVKLVSSNNVATAILAGSGLVLQNSTLVSQSNCIYAVSAQTAKIYGNVASNTNEASAVTISTGTLTVNGAVQ